MPASKTTPLFEKKALPFSELDDLFKKFASELSDGYVTAGDGTSTRYLFVIAGKPYSGAAEDPAGKRITGVKEFFTHYKARGSQDIELVRADRKVLLCMLVTFAHEPEQTFTTDMVNLEDVLKKLDTQENNLVMSLGSGDKQGYAILIRGKVAFVSLPGEEEAGGEDEPPVDRLLLYSFKAGEEGPLNVELYMDTKVAPSEDAVEFPEEGGEGGEGDEGAEGAEGIATYYTEELAEAYIELMEEGKVSGRFPLRMELKIGRDPDNDVWLDEPGVARHHAVVRFEDGKITIEDLKTTLGTSYKGIRIETKELTHNDELNIKTHTLRLDWPARAEKEPSMAETPDLSAMAGAAEKAEPPASLVLDDGTVFPMGSITTMGRDDESDIKLDGVRVAKKHAVVMRGKDFYKLIKKSGLSTLKVNGEKVAEHDLKDGDAIEVGKHTLRFRLLEKD